jgi:hypothetical protein
MKGYLHFALFAYISISSDYTTLHRDAERRPCLPQRGPSPQSLSKHGRQRGCDWVQYNTRTRTQRWLSSSSHPQLNPPLTNKLTLGAFAGLDPYLKPHP